jgi:signal transduction histidine kinase
MIFDSSQCVMLTFRNITQIKENARLNADNKMLQLMSSAVSHEMITPIKCILTMTEDLPSAQSSSDIKRSADLIIVTAQMLLNQIKTNLDRVLLDNNTLQLNL